MSESILRWFGDLHQIVPQFWMTPIIALAAVLSGAMIGWERQRAEKPAGLRTMILICLGSAIFTQASIVLAGGSGMGERGRVAAQIVTGIGFLGAGAIIRERGQVIGITTGAGIWATAAVGMIHGSGFIATGIFFTLLILMTLAAAGRIERIAEGPCSFKRLRIRFDEDGGKTFFRMHCILQDLLRAGLAKFERSHDTSGEAILTYCHLHKEHNSFMRDLVDTPGVEKLESLGG